MLKKIMFCLFIWMAAVVHAHQYQLSVGAIFQNEASYLEEWLRFHMLQGVEHFYLYNHRSTDHYKKVLRPFIKAGIVELIEVNDIADTLVDFNELQNKSYLDAAIRANKTSKWLALIDIDEFLFPVQPNKTLPDILKNYEDCAAVCVNWRMFGTSDVEDIPPGKLMIETLTRCAKPDYGSHHHVKSIIQPGTISLIVNPHFPLFIPGYNFHQHMTDKTPFEGPTSPVLHYDVLVINHYWPRTLKYFRENKIPRRVKWGETPEALLESIKVLNEDQDDLILRYVPILKKQMRGPR